MIDKLDLCTKALSLRKELGEDTTSPVDIFSLAHTIPQLTLVFYPMGDYLSGMCIKNDGNPVIAVNSSMSVGGLGMSNITSKVLGKTKNKTSNKIKFVTSAVAGAKQGKKLGLSAIEGAKIGTKNQLLNAMMHTQTGRKARIQYNVIKDQKASKCKMCGLNIDRGTQGYIDDMGNIFCKQCGIDSVHEVYEYIVPTNPLNKGNPTRSINSTNNQSWLSLQKAKELMNMNFNEKEELSWDNKAVYHMMVDNIRKLEKDIDIFAKDYNRFGGMSRPPTIPEPIQEYLDLGLINEAWTNQKYTYIKNAYKAGWEAWYTANAINVKNVNDEDITKTVEELKDYHSNWINPVERTPDSKK